MPVYTYKGVAANGKAMRGFVDAESVRSARARLRRDGVVLTEIREGGATAGEETRAPSRQISFERFRRISGMDLSIATRQLSTLVGAGVPLVDALGALTEQVENPRLKSTIARVRDRVNEGASLADALGATGVFSDLYLGMIRAGEAGGALEQVLARLADYLESQVRLRNKVGSILIYPAVMFAFAMLVVAALVTVVLPQITQLLQSLKQPLPFYTRAIIVASDFARHWWWAIAIGLAAGVGGFRAAIRTERGAFAWDRFRLRAPILGRVTRLIAVSRFTRTLSTLLAGGIPIVRALDIAKHVANNRVLGAAVDVAKESVMGGAGLARPLRACGEFPPMVTQMVEVGEQSGELESMLDKVAETYDEQVETTMTRVTALLEPLLILLMVGLVLVIILATLVPLLQITSSLK